MRIPTGDAARQEGRGGAHPGIRARHEQMTRLPFHRRGSLTLAALLLALGDVSGQQRGVTRIENEVISVPVTVNDRRGRFITGLKQQDFEVLEDNVPQELTSFTIEESGIAAVLLIDVSA